MSKTCLRIFVCLLCVKLTISASCENNPVDRYVNLIISEQARATNSTLPTDSSAYIAHERNKSISYYDYIIVGGGAAGSVIASRLTEQENISVLLIEAGDEESDFSDIPRMFIFVQGLEYNWNYVSTPQHYSSLGLENRQSAIPRGKGLGGSSILGGSLYMRGNKKDYDDWCDEGNPGWCYDDVLPLFKYSENFKGIGDLCYHGTGGYLTVENVKTAHPQVAAFINANKELGRPEIDFNAAHQLGVSKTQMMNLDGKKLSTSKAFLKPVINRNNLYIEKNSLATKILINHFTKKAYGVLYSKNGVLYEAKCRKEVIVSAGAINTPQLLMLSGIGPEKHLRKLRIPVIKDLPVGYNLQDHAVYFAMHFNTNYTQPAVPLKENVESYLSGFGGFTAGGNAHALAFLKTNCSHTSDRRPHIAFFKTNRSRTNDQPDIAFIMGPSISFFPFIQKAYRYTNETFKAGWGVDPRNSFVVAIILLHPKSRGTIKLKSRFPYQYPEIDPNLLSDREDHDIETLYQGIQAALQLLSTDALKSINATLPHLPLPACQHHHYLSKKYWYCQMRQLVLPIFQPVGTCKMGPTPKHGAVVDSTLSVHGIRNLRVADASIMPTHVSGFANAAVIMIAEKLSKMILNGQ